LSVSLIIEHLLGFSAGATLGRALMVDHNHPVDDTVINVWQANLSVAARETVDLDTVHVDF
jgi:hypothetical protein